MAAGFSMKLRQVTHHGLKRWHVDLSESEAGQRVRKFFDSRAAAEDYARKSAEAVR